MNIVFHKNFSRGYKNLPEKVKMQLKKKLKIFSDDPFHPILNNHGLHGRWGDFRSINVTGDVRVLYRNIDGDTMEFVVIDTHSNLYS